MAPVAGTTHHLTLATDTDTVGYMVKLQRRLFGPERLTDFAPRISTGNEPALREGLWQVWSQTGAIEGIDQYTFKNNQRIYRADGNVFFGRDGAITLQAAATSSDAGKAATAPMLVESGTNILLVGVGTKVRRYNISGGTWSDSTTTLGASCIWLHRHNNIDYACLGTANDMVKSTDNGDTWAADQVNQRFSGLASYKTLLYGWNGATLKCKNGTSGNWNNGGSWVIGDPNTNITNAIEAFNVLIIRKEDGLYLFDGKEVTTLYYAPETLYSGNKCLVYAADGFIYFNEMKRLHKFSMSSGQIANMVPFTPLMIGDAAKELYGHGLPVWMWRGPAGNLFIAFDDGESVYPEVLYHNGLGWHQYYRGASGDTMRMGGFSRLAARTLFNDGTTRYRGHVSLDEFPEANYATSGVWETSDFDGGLPFMYKAFRDISVEVRNMAAGQTLKVEYSTDKGATYATCGTANTDGKLLFSVSAAAVAVGAQHIRFRFTLASNSSANTPVLLRWSCSYLERPNPVYGYKFTVKIGANQRLLDGTREPLSTLARLDFLRQLDGAYSPVTYTVKTGATTFTRKVYVSQISVTQAAFSRLLLKDEWEVDVTLVEALPPARWGAFYWGAAYWTGS